MLLEDNVVVIYRAAGLVGSSGGRTFAREGAPVFSAGRILKSVTVIANEIKNSRGTCLDVRSRMSRLAPR